MVLIRGMLLDFESVQFLQLLPCKGVGNLLILSGTLFVYLLGTSYPISPVWNVFVEWNSTFRYTYRSGLGVCC